MQIAIVFADFFVEGGGLAIKLGTMRMRLRVLYGDSDVVR